MKKKFKVTETPIWSGVVVVVNQTHHLAYSIETRLKVARSLIWNGVAVSVLMITYPYITLHVVLRRYARSIGAESIDIGTDPRKGDVPPPLNWKISALQHR